MKSAPKMSRNQRRKALYSSLADKGSRNQDTIEVVACPACGGGRSHDGNRAQCGKCGGIGSVPVAGAVTVESLVVSRTPKRESDARKRRRQIAAWGRCRTLLETGKHSGHDLNCKCCGCPVSEQAA